jgi:translation initiation factor IF-2
MIRTVTGTCDGQQTSLDAIVDVGEASAKDYIKNGYAEAVVEERVEAVVEEKVEAAVEEEVAVEEVEVERAGAMTAEMAPPQNAAEHVSKPVPRRGPGRPRKQV